MDNAQKAIMIGVGLFITIIIISAVLLIVNLGTGLVDDATGELGSMSTTLQNQILQTYDGKILSGTQVRAATSQYANDSELCIVVISKDGNSVVGETGYAALNATNVIDKIKTSIGQSNVTVASVKPTDLYVTWGTPSGGVTRDRTTASEFASSVNPAYINTSKNYKSSVIRNGNDTVIGIAFQVAN